MTSRKSFFNVNIMWETVRQYKYLMVLHTILLFLVTTMPGYISIQNMLDTLARGGAVSDYAIESIAHSLTGTNPLMFLAVLGVPTIVGACVFSHLFKPNATEFYNSMPYTRECVYISKFASEIILCVIPMIVVFGLNSVLYAANSLGRYGDVFPYWQMLSGWGDVVFAYVIVLALGAFAASLSGNAFAMGIVMAFCALVYPATTLSVMWACDAWISKFDIYFNYALEYIFPPLMLIIWRLDGSVRTIGADIYAALYATAFFAVGLFCYKARKSENTKNFFAFKKVGSFLKYYVSLVGSLVFGTIFFVAGDANVLIGYVGYILMLFILFSAMQAIFDKNMRGMFKNMKRFAVFALIWAAALIIPMSGVISDYVPKAKSVSSIEVYDNGLDIDVKERGSIDKIMALAEKEESEQPADQYLYPSLMFKNPLFYGRVSLQMTEEEYEDLEEVIFNSSDYKDRVKKILASNYETAQIEKCFTIISAEKGESALPESTVSGAYESYERYGIPTEQYEKFREILAEEIDKYDYKTARSSGAFAELSQSTAYKDARRVDYYSYENIIIYNCYEKSVEYLEENTPLGIFSPSAKGKEKFYEIKKLRFEYPSEEVGGLYEIETTDPKEIEIIEKSLVYGGVARNGTVADVTAEVVNEFGAEQAFQRSYITRYLSDEAKDVAEKLVARKIYPDGEE